MWTHHVGYHYAENGMLYCAYGDPSITDSVLCNDDVEPTACSKLFSIQSITNRPERPRYPTQHLVPVSCHITTLIRSSDEHRLKFPQAPDE